jgi:hypothetical protein
MRDYLLIIIIFCLAVISLYLNDLRRIEFINICKDNPMLVIPSIVYDCDCEKLLKKYNIKVKGE